LADDRLQILIEAFDSTKAAFADIQKSVIDLKKEMRNVTEETQKQTAVVQDLGAAFHALKAQILEIVAIVYAFKKMWDMAEATAEIHEQEAALDNLGKKYGMTGAQIASMLDEASDGLLKYSDQLKLATKGTALGFDPTLLADFVYYATRLKEINPGKTVAEITDAIMRASTGVRGGGGALIDMGVLANTREGVKRLSDELERSSAYLTAQERQAAATNIVLAALSMTVDGLGPKVESAHDAMTKLGNVLGDIGRFLGDIGLKVIGGLGLLFAGLIEAAYGLVNAFAFLIDSYASWLELASKVPLLGKLITKEDAAAMHGYADSIGKAADSMKGFQEKVYNFSGVMMGVDMPSTGKPPHVPSNVGIMPGGSFTAEQAKKQTEVLKAQLAANIEALKLNSAEENDIRRTAVSDLQVFQAKSLITMEDFLAERAAIEKVGIQIEINNLEKERSETAGKFDQIIALWVAVGGKRTEVEKFTQEQRKALSTIDIQLAQKNSALKISLNTEEIRVLLTNFNIEEARRQALITKLQQEISVRQQMNSLLVEFNRMTPLEQTRQQIADQDELNKKKIDAIDLLLRQENITAAQKIKLEAEKNAMQAEIDSQEKRALNEERLLAAGLKSLDIAKQHTENALKLTEQYAQLTGDYQTAYDLQVKILEVEKQRKLLVPGITEAEAAAISKLYNEQIYRAELMKTPAGAFAVGATDIANEFQDTSKQMYQLARNTASDMSSAFSEGFFQVMKGNFQDLYKIATNFLDAIAKRIFNMAADQTTGWIFRGLGAGKPTPSGNMEWGPTWGEPFHEGSHGVIRVVPRLHKGLAPDEFPAILQTGERVLSRSEVNAGAPNVTINIENKTGQEVKQSNVGTSFNGKDYVISIVLEAARNNMGFRNALGLGG
jgi:hypothetical protein